MSKFKPTPVANAQGTLAMPEFAAPAYGTMPPNYSLIEGGPLASTPAAPVSPSLGGKSAQDDAMMDYLLTMGEFTPQEAAQKRKEGMAAMMRQDGDSPVLIDTGRLKVASPWAALGNAANKVGAGIMANRADAEQTAIGGRKVDAFRKLQAARKPVAKLFGGDGGAGGGTDTLAGDTGSLRAALLAAAQAGENTRG